MKVLGGRRGLPMNAVGASVALAALLAGGCGTLESKRIEQLLVERGFGKRTHGDAQVENYVAFGDTIQFFIPPAILMEAGTEPLAILAAGQQVGIDGTIFIPFIGAIPVLGLTERELSTLVSEQVQAVYDLPIQVQARIINNQKFYFVAGEFARGRRLLQGDYTILEVFFDNPPTPLANVGRIRLVRPDPKNPLVVIVNLREMILTGDTTWNLAVKENDIIYAPPTFFGSIARFLEKALIPFGTVLNALFQGLFMRAAYRAVVHDEPFFFYPQGFGGGRLF